MDIIYSTVKDQDFARVRFLDPFFLFSYLS